MSQQNESLEKENAILVIGTGGVGGSIASFLALADKNVSCIARGEHLKAIREKGIQLHSDLKGEHFVPVKAYTAEEYNAKADVIYVCVKAYSLPSIRELLIKACHENTIVIPIINVYGTGNKIQKMIPGKIVLDGCIYVVAYIAEPGEIIQTGKTFRIVYGMRNGQKVPYEKLESIRKDLTESGIKATVSDNITRETFIKWAFISAAASTGAYYDVPMKDIQKEGKERNTFIKLSEEIAEIGRKSGIVQEDLTDYNLKVLDKMSPESTSSMQKDLARRHESEIDGLLFEVIRQAGKLGIDVPTYCKIAQKFK